MGTFFHLLASEIDRVLMSLSLSLSRESALFKTGRAIIIMLQLHIIQPRML